MSVIMIYIIKLCNHNDNLNTKLLLLLRFNIRITSQFISHVLLGRAKNKLRGYIMAYI